MEAWIETYSFFSHIRSYLSPPSWRRGLKPQLSKNILQPLQVASFMEAWIETQIFMTTWQKKRCRLLHGGVDWNRHGDIIRNDWKCRLLHGGVDWNCSVYAHPVQIKSPPSWRRGLKWICVSYDESSSASRLLHGGVDWNRIFYNPINFLNSRLLHGGVDWNLEL